MTGVIVPSSLPALVEMLYAYWCGYRPRIWHDEKMSSTETTKRMVYLHAVNNEF